MPVAFFDIDSTILSVNSAKLWLRHELRKGSLSKRHALRGAIWAGLYGLGVANVERVLREAVSQLEGRQESLLREETRAFYEREIQQTIRPGARRTIAAHRDVGDAIVLLTSSSNYMAECVARTLECDGYLSNAFVVRADHFTGAPVEPLCYGAGKIEHARDWALAHEHDLARASFYTDSFTDLPMLAAVGTPVAVHPDPRLRRAALRRGWRIESWNR